jgi:phage shock protein PspC (stress-responsive transcriptional regulator)
MTMSAQTTEIKRLYKSKTDRMIDGVCAGIAEYMSIDPTLVRIAFVLLLLYGGFGLILYLVGLIFMPTAPAGFVAKTDERPQPSQRSNTLFWGVLLVSAGALWLLSNMGFVVWHRWWGFSWSVALAVLLILAGVAFLFGGRSYVSSSGAPVKKRSRTRKAQDAFLPEWPQAGGKLYRSRTGRKILGVCGGLGNYFAIDPTILRLLFIVAVLASGGLMIIPYLIMAVIVPLEPAPVQTP